jgi:hypothetical protein
MRLNCAALVFLLAAPGAAVASGDKVGELSDVHAWVDKMPGTQASLHITGLITAPTPCHEATTEEVADPTGADFSIAVAIEDPPAGSMCIQVLSDIQFNFEKPSDAGRETATVTSQADNVTVDIVH